MDENNYYLRRRHVPAFGSWDYCNDEFSIPFTECFDSARETGLFHYNYSQDSDLYVTGDLYQNDIVTPAMIVVPRRKKKTSYQDVGKEARKDAWVVCDFDKEPPSLVPQAPKIVPKAVDEDLYKISPELLYAKPKRKGIRGFMSSCLLPTCAC